MALNEVQKILYGRRLQDGVRIDFEIIVDRGQGPKQITYTWDPEESGWPMADEITAMLFSDETIEIHDFVFVPPDRDLLVMYLQSALKRLRVRDYVEREISTQGAEPVPQHIVDGAEFARSLYNRWKDDPASIPEDWRDPKHWIPPVTA